MESEEKDRKDSTRDVKSRGRRVDLHCHSVHSGDCNISVSRLVDIAVGRGMDGMALTDHNTVAGHRELESLEGNCEPGFLLIPGCEVSSVDGHILALGVAEAPPRGRSLEETLGTIVDMGGVPVLAHPFRQGNGVTEETIRRAPEGAALECINGRSFKGYNRRAAALGKEIGRILTGGSDAHSGGEVGRAWTVFPGGVSGMRDVLDALERGEVTAGGRGLSMQGLVLSKLRGVRRRMIRINKKGRKSRTSKSTRFRGSDGP